MQPNIYRFHDLPNTSKEYADFSFYTVGSDYHIHADYYEIILVTKGEIKHFLGDTVSILPKGILALLKPEVSHAISINRSDSVYFSLCIEKQYFEKLTPQMFSSFDLKNIPSFITKSVTEEKLKFMEHLGQSITRGNRQVKPLANRFLFITLTDYLSRSETFDCNTFVSDLIQKLNNDTYLTASVEEICANYPYSHSMLLRQFKEQTGMTIAEYKVRQKMKYACHLLEKTDTKIVDIAATLSYDSLSYFFQTFKKHIGVTPSEYRNNHDYRLMF